MNRTRLALLDLAMGQPGISIMGAARELGVARTTVRHHVRVLVATQRLRVLRAGKIPALFAACSGVTSASTAPGTDLLSRHLEVLRNDVRRALLDLADHSGRVDHAAFTAWAAGHGLPHCMLSESGFRYHCAILQRAGLLRRERGGWSLAVGEAVPAAL